MWDTVRSLRPIAASFAVSLDCLQRHILMVEEWWCFGWAFNLGKTGSLWLQSMFCLDIHKSAERKGEFHDQAW